MKKENKLPSPENSQKRLLTIEGIQLELSHLDKVFWPEDAITKGELIDYYDKISDLLLPYLRGRPESLKRNPNGWEEEGFFQKDSKEIAPAWAKTITVHSESAGKDIHYFLCNDKASLLFLVNLGCIEMNPWNSRTHTLDKPDYCILDLDPGEKNNFDDIVEVAQAIHEITELAHIPTYCKTSGSRGLHIYIPLGALYSYEASRNLALSIAKITTRRLPALTTLQRSLLKRPAGRIYIDYLQNKKGATLASVYSVRPRVHATVSTPLDWKEVTSGLRPQQFTLRNIHNRIAKKGDLFAGILGKGIDLKTALESLSEI